MASPPRRHGQTRELRPRSFDVAGRAMAEAGCRPGVLILADLRHRRYYRSLDLKNLTLYLGLLESNVGHFEMLCSSRSLSPRDTC